MTRKVLWPILAIGVALIIAPFALSMQTRAPAGQRMMDDFNPLMQPANVQTTADYYYDVFVPLGNIVPLMSKANVAKFQAYVDGFGGMQADAAKLVPALAAAMNMTPAQVQRYMAENLPAMSALLANLPAMRSDFEGFIGAMSKNVDVFAQVPAGLAHYEPLVTTMQGNVKDYEQVNSLPSFGLFTWFFVVPGFLLVLLAGWSLFVAHRVEAPTRARPIHI